MILKRQGKTDKVKNKNPLKSHLLLYVALICRRWIVRAKDYNPTACAALWWEDTNPVPVSVWQIAPAIKAVELPSVRGQPSSSAGFSGQPFLPAALRNWSLLLVQCWMQSVPKFTWSWISPSASMLLTACSGSHGLGYINSVTAQWPITHHRAGEILPL